jgi:polysaccharide biosynthesis transport protein
VVFVRESLDNSVHTPDDIRDWLNLPSLAVLPRVSANAADHTWRGSRGDESLGVVMGSAQSGRYPKLFWYSAQSAEAEAIRGLRTALLVAGPRQGPAPKVVLVSSAAAGEGKTTVAINLASVLAQQGKTCLIDGDLRRPMIEPAMALRAKTGLAEVLNGKSTLAESLITNTGVPGLSVLPAKALPENPSDLLASGAMAQVLHSLRDTFSYVVIDSPPVIPFSDARSLAPLADAVILVSRYGVTTRRTITRGAEILNEMHAPLLGVVLNDMDLSSADYHYFNYGYSWRTVGNKSRYGQRYLPPPPRANDSGSEQARGAHA